MSGGGGRRWWPVIVGIAILAMVLALVLPGAMGGPEIPVQQVERREVVETLVASGRVRASARGEIASPVVGTIAASFCRPGLRVEAGAVLYRLRDEEARAAVAEARARTARAAAQVEELAGPERTANLEALRQAELELVSAEDRLVRTEQLLQSGAIERVEADNARRARDTARSRLDAARSRAQASESRGSRTRVAEAELEQARASLAAAQARLDQMRIEAPQAGVVATCDAVAGGVVTPGRMLLTIVLDGPKEIVIEPDEKNLALLAPGQKAKVSADAFPDQVFGAEVSTIVAAVDPVRGTVEVRLTALDPPSFLIPDMTVSVEVEARRKAGALVIPRIALRDVGVSPWVLVAENGRAARRDVRIGLAGDELVEVAEGLTEGAWVLVPGTRRLEPGTRVRSRVKE